MSFTKQHYVTIANLVRQEKKLVQGDEARGVLDTFAVSMAEAFEVDNALFDKPRFLKACGVTTE